MPSIQNKKSYGFTVIELLTVTALTGLLIATITPYFHQLRKKLQLHQTCDTIAQHLQELLPLALLTRQPASLYTTPDLHQFNAVTGTRTIQIPNSYNYQATRETINCYPTSACNPASVNINSPDFNCQISLSLRGRVKINMDPA